MNYLVASATAAEIKPFLDYYRHSEEQPDVDILITGVGLVAATYSFAKQIAIKKPGIIIQAGIAGCFDHNISLGTVVVTKQDRVADEGVLENGQFKSSFDLGLVAPDHSPFKNGWLVNNNTELLKKTKLKLVNGISVNQISTDKDFMIEYTKRFDAAIESMEGAALHYVALQEGIPFLQLRSISNYVGERDKKKWKMGDAIGNLNKSLIKLLTSLNDN